MQFKTLMQRNPAYDETAWAELDVLNAGGIRAMREARTFISKLDGEKEARFEDRLRLVAYVPYIAQIIGFFGSALFQSGLDVTEAADAADPTTPGKPASAKPEGAPPVAAGAHMGDFWVEFAKDADRKGTPFSSIVRTAVEAALLKKKALVALDFPAPEKKPENRLEEKRLGVERGFAYNLDVEKLLDWELDDEGRLEWAILYEKTASRPNPKATRSLACHAWTLWYRGDVAEVDPEALKKLADLAENGGTIQDASAIYRTLQKRNSVKAADVARWERYEITVPIDFKDWRDDTEIPLVDEGTTSFAEIPILVLELPEGLWAGNILLPMAREHWGRRSALVGAEARNMTATTYAELTPDDGGLGTDALDASTKRALRDRGVDVVLPGRLGVAEPEAKAYEVISRELKELKDEMFRVAHQMAMSVDNASSAKRQSGESKSQDKKDVDVVLGALAVLVKTFAVRIYRALAVAMKEEDVVWTARGLDKFVGEDRNDLVQEGINLGIVAEEIPSPTWKKETLTQFALRWTPNLDPTTQDTIRKEIAEGVDVHQELDDKLLENEKDAAEDTPTPGEVHADNVAVAKEAAKNGAGAGAPPPNGKGPPPKGAAKPNGKPKEKSV